MGATRALILPAIACMLIGCGGSHSDMLTRLDNNNSNGMILAQYGAYGGGLEADTGSSSVGEALSPATDGQQPAGMLIALPQELRDEFNEVYDALLIQHKTSLHIVNSCSLEHQRALAYYQFGTYSQIMLSKLVLIMVPGPPGATNALAASIAAEQGCNVSRSCHLGGRDIHYLEYVTDMQRAELAAAADAILREHSPTVAYCGAESCLSYADSPQDPQVRFELGQCYSPLHVSAPLAWESTRGRNQYGEPVLVALFDSGIYRDINDDTYLPQGEHEDLEGVCYNLGDHGYQVNFSGSEGEDIFSPWEDLSDTSPVNYPYQTLGHGTRVAGVIAAQTNSIGVAGIAPDVKIVPFRLYVQSLAYIPVGNFIAAAEICTEAKAAGHPIRVVNISAHVVDGEETPDLELAMRALSDADILIVSSATGNAPNAQGSEPFWQFPAAYKAFADGSPIPNIIAVAWLGLDNRFKDFYSETMLTEDDWDWSLTDVFAPSEHMMLTNADGSYLNDPPSQASGVSFGIPVVAGIAALYAACDPQSTAAQIKQKIIESARPIFNFGLQPNGNSKYKKAYAGNIGLADPPIYATSTQFVCDRYSDVISPDSQWGSSRSSRINISTRDFQYTESEIVIINDTYVEYLDEVSYYTSALLSIPVYSGGMPVSYDYYTRTRTPLGWVAWGNPQAVYNASSRERVSGYSENVGSGYIIFSPSSNPEDNFLVNYGSGTATTGLEPSEYPLELEQGNGGIDTLLLTCDSLSDVYRVRWHVCGLDYWPDAVEFYSPENFCTLGSLGQYAGCAWLNPDSNSMNIGQVDFANGQPFEVDWDFVPAAFLNDVIEGWPNDRDIVDIKLAGSPQGLHYLIVVSRNFVPGGSTFVIEGIRVMTEGGFSTVPVIETLLSIPMETETTAIRINAQIDQGNRLFIYYVLSENDEYQSNGFYRQTLDYGNVS